MANDLHFLLSSSDEDTRVNQHVNTTPASLDRRRFLAMTGSVMMPLHLIESLKLARAGPNYPHTADVALEDFHCEEMFTAFGSRRKVYWRGESGPGVIVLHELPGLTPADLDFVSRLASHGFRVYAPLLFGAAKDDAFFRHFMGECVFGRWPWDELAPVNPWVAPLLTLCDEVARRTSKRIGVIGMCLTGIMPISLMKNDAVVAPVLSQPTMPFPVDDGRAKSLGLAPGEADHASMRLKQEDLKILAFRASTDRFCQKERMATLCKTFPGRVIEADVNFGMAKGHSILAGEFHRDELPDDVKARVRDAFMQTVGFLHERLGG